MTLRQVWQVFAPPQRPWDVKRCPVRDFKGGRRQKGWSFFAKMWKKAVKKWLSFAASEVKNALWLGLRWWLGKLKEQSAEKNLQPTIEAPPKRGANQYPTGQKGYQTFWKRPKGQLDKFFGLMQSHIFQLSFFLRTAEISLRFLLRFGIGWYLMKTFVTY